MGPNPSPTELPHRSIRRFRLRWHVLALDAAMLTALSVALWFSLRWVLEFWAQQFEFWGSRTGLVALGTGASVQLSAAAGMPKLVFNTVSVFPSATLWWASTLLSLVLWVGASRMSRERLPLIYFLRLLLLVHATALLYFYVWPDRLPIATADYLSNLFQQTTYLLLLLPALLGLVLFPFAVPAWARYGAVLASLLFLVLVVPLQAVCSAWLLSTFSVLLLPVMYLFFGLLPQMLALLGIYGFALSLMPPDAVLVERGLLVS